MAKKKKPIGLRVRNKLWNYAVRFTKNKIGFVSPARRDEA